LRCTAHDGVGALLAYVELADWVRPNLNLPFVAPTYVWTILTPDFYVTSVSGYRVYFSHMRISMSSFQQRTKPVTDMRLAAIASATANLKAQLSELEKLREQVTKAQLSA
jgi:hypothetical protein